MTLAVAGALAFSWGAPQASAALFVAAGCTLLSSVATGLIVGSANAARAEARVRHAEEYGEHLQNGRL